MWREALARLARYRERRLNGRTRSIGAAPIGLVVLVAIVCVVVAVLSAAERADDVELQQERRLLTQAIADRGGRVLRELENVAASSDIVLQLHYNFDPDWVHHLVGLRLATFFDHDHVFVVDRTDHLTYAMLDNKSVNPARFEPSRADLGRIIELLRGVAQPFDDEVLLHPSTDLNRPRRAQRLQLFMNRPAIVAGVGANVPNSMGAVPGGPTTLVLAVKYLDGQLLSDVSARFDLPNLRTTGQEPPNKGETFSIISDGAGAPIARFAWIPNQPGGKIVSTVLPFMAIAFGGFALLTGFALRYIRRTATKLVEGETRLRHLALHDPLSGLPNRTAFSERLAAVIADSERDGAVAPGGGDDGGQPVAERGAVRQAGQGIMQGQMAQAVLALGKLHGGAADVAQRESGQQREAAERDRHERQHRLDDLAAGLVRDPGEARDRHTGAVGEDGEGLALVRRLLADRAQIGQVEARADVGEKLPVEIFDGKHQRGRLARCHAHAVRHVGADAGDDRRAVLEQLQPLRAARTVEIGRGIGRGIEHDLVLERLRDPAQKLDDAPEIIARRFEALRLHALVFEHRVGEAVGAIDDEDMIVVEEGREPQADQMMHPVGIEIVVKLQDDIARGRDVLQFAQHALSAIGDRLGEQAALLVQLDVVGALGRGQDGDHDAHDRDENDETDRRRANGARTSVQSALTVLRESRQSLPPHGRPLELTS